MRTAKQKISATILADSVSAQGKRLITFEFVYPRLIHAELMTHRLFSRNAASSRAIPVLKKLKQIWFDPYVPETFGANKAGMQSGEELSPFKSALARAVWLTGSKFACAASYLLYKLNVHKQWANRLVEPYEWYKVIVSATEWDNFYWLRTDAAAQPQIQILAKEAKKAQRLSVPLKLQPGEWHLPYVETKRDKEGKIFYRVDGKTLSLKDAISVSASCCAQVSYRNLDFSLDKAKRIYERLISSEPCHYSPMEHQATPMKKRSYTFDQTLHDIFHSQRGITHLDAEDNLWSGNFMGWIQNRQLIQESTGKRKMTVK